MLFGGVGSQQWTAGDLRPSFTIRLYGGPGLVKAARRVVGEYRREPFDVVADFEDLDSVGTRRVEVRRECRHKETVSGAKGLGAHEGAAGHHDVHAVVFVLVPEQREVGLEVKVEKGESPLLGRLVYEQPAGGGGGLRKLVGDLLKLGVLAEVVLGPEVGLGQVRGVGCPINALCGRPFGFSV